MNAKLYLVPQSLCYHRGRTWRRSTVPLLFFDREEVGQTQIWMFTVTPTMCATLAELLEQGNVSRHLALRVVVNERDQLDVTLESAQTEDEVFSFRGRVVLAVDPNAAQRLAGRRLDVSS